jgi:hypothetical protein
MTDSPDHVVIPYSRFLECLERRRAIAAELIQPRPPTTDADVPPVPNHPPAPVSPTWRTS